MFQIHEGRCRLLFRAQLLLRAGSTHSFGGMDVQFLTAAMAIVLVHTCLVHTWGVPFISKKAVEEKYVSCQIWGPHYLFGGVVVVKRKWAWQ
jgi:hypothetical protein